MIYPFIEEDDIDEGNIQDIPIPREYGVDFKTGQLTGRVVEGLEAVMVWVWAALKTAKGRYYIYSEDYGQEFDSLVGMTDTEGLAEMEYQRMIEECLEQNGYIEGIDEYEFYMDGDRAIIHFRLVTMFGEGIVDVRGDDIRIDPQPDAE